MTYLKTQKVECNNESNLSNKNRQIITKETKHNTSKNWKIGMSN